MIEIIETHTATSSPANQKKVHELQPSTQTLPSLKAIG